MGMIEENRQFFSATLLKRQTSRVYRMVNSVLFICFSPLVSAITLGGTVLMERKHKPTPKNKRPAFNYRMEINLTKHLRCLYSLLSVTPVLLFLKQMNRHMEEIN